MTRPSKNAARTTIPGEITLLLADITDPESLRTVMQLAYGDLHDIAVHHFSKERPGGTLQPTALVNEAWLRLAEPGARFKNRKYFFAAASTTMRRILVEGARRRGAIKRGGRWHRVDFAEAERLGFEQPAELLNFDAALTRLQTLQPRWSEVAQLRVFGQCTTGEAAAILGIGRSTARRRWRLAKQWLREDLVGNR